MSKFSFKNTTIQKIKDYFNEVHKDFYDYSLFTEYINSECLVEIICPNHGIFKQSCYLHSKGHGCKKCIREKVESEKYKGYKDNFINSITTKFKDKLSITGDYVNNGTRVKYKCNSCNIEYENTPNKLLSKGNVGCAYCYGDGKNKQTISYFEKYKELLIKEKGFVYIVKLYNTSEEFIKIGITKEESCEKRFAKIPYNKEILFLQENSMYNCFKIEQYLLKEGRDFLYKPSIWFGGATECLLLESLHNVEINVKLLMAESLGQI
jgi:hypothetical protein